MSGSLPELATEPQGDFIVAEEQVEDYDEGFENGSDTTSLTSLASQIRNGVMEYGRIYAAFGKSEYGCPRDEEEKDRMDAMHEKYFLLLGRRRYWAPLDNDPKEILELGTSTGIWCIDMADEFPSASITGVDISPMQPTWIPPNCHFEIDDIEEPWVYRKKFDFIFGRDLLFSIRDFPTLIRQCYDNLNPGGWIEFEAINGTLRCDDNTLPADSFFCEFDREFRRACEGFGTPLDDSTRYKNWFEAAGFETVVEHRLKVPCNSWPKDPLLKMVGIFERENLVGGLEAIALRAFTRGLGWSAEQTMVFFAKARKDIRNTAYHTYYPFYVVYGRKPLNAPLSP